MKNAVIVLVAIVLAGIAGVSAQTPNITGKWVFEVQTEQGGGSPVFEFKQDGEKLTGKYTGAFGSADLTGTVKGNDMVFAFKADAQGTMVDITYKGTIEKDTIKGTLDLAGMATGTFTGKKQ